MSIVIKGLGRASGEELRSLRALFPLVLGPKPAAETERLTLQGEKKKKSSQNLKTVS